MINLLSNHGSTIIKLHQKTLTHFVWVASKISSVVVENAVIPAVMHALLFALTPVTEKGSETLPPGATSGIKKVIGPISRAGSTSSLIKDTASVN